MKHAILLVAGAALLSSPLAALSQAPTQTLGRILLDVQRHGEAWYVLPDSSERVYFPNGTAAYGIMRSYGLGITDADLAKIPVGLLPGDIVETDGDLDGLGDQLEEALGTNPGDADSDDDGFPDGTEIANGYDPLGPGRLPTDASLVERLKGKILLQVENRGQAWYVHPEDGKRYYMKDGETAYVVMRRFSLGAVSSTIDSIPVAEKLIDCAEDFECFILAVENGQSAEVLWKNDQELFGGTYARSTQRVKSESVAGNDFRYSSSYEDLEYYLPDEVRAELVAEGVMTNEEIDEKLALIKKQESVFLATRQECTYGPGSGIVGVLRKWQGGDFDVGVSGSILGGEMSLTGDWEEIGQCVQISPPSEIQCLGTPEECANVQVEIK